MHRQYLLKPRSSKRVSPFFAWAQQPVPASDKLAYNLLEKPDSFQLEMALPGLSQEDLSIEVEKNTLVLKAASKEENDIQYLRKEYGFGSFERKFKLSDAIDQQEISARMEAGILRVTLPKKEEAKEQAPRSITIQ